MALDTYNGLKAALPRYLGRDGDTSLDSAFDELLALAEDRIYNGSGAPGMPDYSAPVRVSAMETVDDAFTLAELVAVPSGFLEVVSATLVSPVRPLTVQVGPYFDALRVSGTSGTPELIAVQGSNFRIYPDPGSTYTAKLVYYARLTTPAGSSGNWFTTTTPRVYLRALMAEAAAYVGDLENAAAYIGEYNRSIAGMVGANAQSRTAGAPLRIRLRASTP